MLLWKRTRRRHWLKWSGGILACLVLFIVFAYAYDAPGGIADWRYARAAGISGTISIPTGHTPEEAVEKFRHTPMQVIHQESINGGVLLFLQRNEQQEGTHLQIEFVRKTWLGRKWKWVMGGGYGFGERSDSNEALSYMSMPKYNGIHGPFPIVFGQIKNSTIQSVIVTISGKDAGEYHAKLIDYGKGQRLWYTVLPSSATDPYGIIAYNSEGVKVASTSFDDSRDADMVLMTQNPIS